ncbi:MAG: SUMF1/EgtB/PvdO family nonheme iron enzyme [Verrucomicrobia bacterium]|nr:SUMF1/EgtB/PvdO family nonheme iron enzyme [Verrucomicrobiota bacterium]
MTNKVLGDYNLIKQLGQGALGKVYLAEHRFMKRHYSLKVLPEELATDRGFVARFEEDVRRLSALEHPHIVKIHNVSYSQGVYFLVTDCVVDEIHEPMNLAQYLAQRNLQLSEQEILSLLRQVADALDYAHGSTEGEGAIVHRGVKPSNVLLGKNRHLYLSDFGLSRIVGLGRILRHTCSGLADGISIPQTNRLCSAFRVNYACLSPEQRRGVEEEVTPKTDAYAFGVLAYYLLTRDLPEGLFQLPSKSVPSLSLNWDGLIQACLSTDPENRPISLLDALDEVEEEEIQAPRPQMTAVSVPAAKIQPKFATPPSSPSPALRNIVVDTSSQPKFRKVEVPSAIAKPQWSAPEATATAVVTLPQREVETEEGPYASPLNRNVTAYQPAVKETRTIEPIPTEMIIVPAGTYWRGSNDGNRDEMPRHLVHLESFAVDIHPVTNEQFLLFLEYMQGEKDDQNHDLIVMRDSRVRRSAGKLLIESGYAKHPVVGVTWYGAMAYAKWVGKRLPTEAEWEVAASGGDANVPYPTGDAIEKSLANFFSSDTTPVMSYPPNLQGLYDMAGNVYEWCQDWYGYNYYDTSEQEPNAPKGPHQGVYRVLRGGCWKSLKEDLRCSHRHRNNPGTVNGTYGFRCAISQ